jgi:putative aldouronate transport system permease protein
MVEEKWHMNIKLLYSKNERILLAVIYVILFFALAVTLYPQLNILAKAFSGYEANVTGRVTILPIDFQVHTFKKVVCSKNFLTSFLNSLYITVIGTILSVLVSAMAAYALSRKRLHGRTAFTILFVFTMMFGGGLIPNYILIKELGLLNTRLALFLPNAISVYNMLILKSSFEAIPQSLEESAKIDGARNLDIFFRIMLPVSVPTIAAVSLFLAVGYWNEYWSALMYITKDELKPLQLYLYDVISYYTSDSLNRADASMLEMDSPEGIKAVTIIAATLPIIVLYPFIQKFFVKGVMIGSVKE